MKQIYVQIQGTVALIVVLELQNCIEKKYIYLYKCFFFLNTFAIIKKLKSEIYSIIMINEREILKK